VARILILFGSLMLAASPRTAAPPRQLISVAKAAAECGVTTRTIYNWITSGRLRAYRTGPTLLRIDSADLDRQVRPVPTAGNGAA
jgi:excisionase family DNA binding protein